MIFYIIIFLLLYIKILEMHRLFVILMYNAINYLKVLVMYGGGRHGIALIILAYRILAACRSVTQTNSLCA